MKKEENIYEDLIQRQRIKLKQSEFKEFRNSLFGISIAFIILAIFVFIYKSASENLDYTFLIVFLGLAVIYMFLHFKSKNIKIGLKFTITATLFYLVHSGLEYYLGLYPVEVMKSLSFSHLESTYSGAARTMNIVTLAIDLIPHMYFLVRLAILGIFIKGIISTSYLENNKSLVESVNNS